MQFRWWQCSGLVVAMAGLVAGSACSRTPGDPAPKPMDFSSRQTQVPGEYLVTLAAGADIKVIAELYGRFGIKGTQELGRNVFLVRLSEDPGPAKLEELRSRNAQIKSIQPNFVYRASGRGNIQ